MALEKLNPHYSFTTPASVHDEEALTALELAGRQGAKINEIVDSQNHVLSEFELHKGDVDARCTEHETFVDNTLEYYDNTVIPSNVKLEVAKQINDGTFDRAISEYANNLEGRVDNLLGSMTTGGTTMDGEVIDARVDYSGQSYPNVGEAVRTVTESIYKRHRNWVVGAELTANYPPILNITNGGKNIQLRACHLFTANSYISITSTISYSFLDLVNELTTGASFYLVYDANADDIELRRLDNRYPKEITGDVFIIALVLIDKNKNITGLYACEDIKRNTYLENEPMYPYGFPECKYDEVHHNSPMMMFNQILCIGDSYTSGHIEDADGGAMPSTNSSYPDYLRKILNTNVVNAGVSGLRTSDFFESNTDSEALTRKDEFSDLLNTALYTSDAFIFCVGLNDIGKTTVGEITDNLEDETYCGVVNYFIDAISSMKPKSHIFIMSVPGEGLLGQYSMHLNQIVNARNSNYVHFIRSSNVMLDTSPMKEEKLGNHLTPLGYLYLAEEYIHAIDDYINRNKSKFVDVHKGVFALNPTTI